MKMPWMRRPDATIDTTGAPATGETTPFDVVASPETTPASGPDTPVVGGPPVTNTAPAASGAEATVPGPATPHVVKRRGLIPAWAPWAAGGVGVLILIVIAIVLLLSRADSVRVPSLQGLDRASAMKRTKELGLVLVVRDTRFSAVVPAGAVIDQTPATGAVVSAGSIVRVDLSAGSETFAMPDVVGKALDAARTTLRDRGLDVQFETAASDAEQGTVISSLPSAGTTVTTGATVRLTVAAGVSSTDTLLPSDLTGTGFVLDPAPSPTGATSDVAFDVARRVRALLEASGARVTVTRAVTDTAATATSLIRLRHAKESTATAMVGLLVAPSGSAGIQVQSAVNTGTAAATFSGSTTLAQALLSGLRTNYASTTTTTTVGDAVLEGIGVPAARIRLGSNALDSDKTAFADAQWLDNVARDIYRALASTYGKR